MKRLRLAGLFDLFFAVCMFGLRLFNCLTDARLCTCLSCVGCVRAWFRLVV